MHSKASLLTVENLSVFFRSGKARTQVLDGVSFKIDHGETLALVGESGSGKSVTSLAIMRLLADGAITEGRISFDNRNCPSSKDILRLDEKHMQKIRGDEIAMIFQEPMTSLNPVQPVGKQIAEVLLIHRGKRGREAMAAVQELLRRVGIRDPERTALSYPHELSGGMRQRVMIAMALICEPLLLIADEPTTALDVTIQAQILQDLKSLQQRLGMAMLFISHDLAVVSQIADRIVVMYAGWAVESGSTAQILSRPLHPYTRALLEARPTSSTDRERPLNAIPGAVMLPGDPVPGCRFHPRCSHAVKGRCDAEVPAMEDAGEGRSVKCLRWKEIGHEQ